MSGIRYSSIAGGKIDANTNIKYLLNISAYLDYSYKTLYQLSKELHHVMMMILPLALYNNTIILFL